MPFDPETIVGEILGQRARKGADPSATGFLCPYIKSRCPKRSTQLRDEPYPVCTLWRRSDGEADPAQDLIPICPKRFYAVDFLTEVVAHCWPGDAPKNPMVAPEVKMAGFGNVDFVIADVQPDGEVETFGNYILYLAGRFRHKILNRERSHEPQYHQPHLSRRSQGRCALGSLALA